MSLQEYYHVFESILYAAVVTQILFGWSKMITERGTYNVYWLHILITANMLLFIVQRYFSSQQFRDYEMLTNSLSFLLIVIVPLSLVYMGTYALFPKSCAGSDFRAIVVNSRIIVGLGMMVMLGITVFRNLVITKSYNPVYYVPHTGYALLWIWFMISKNLKVASVASVLGFLTICFFLWVD